MGILAGSRAASLPMPLPLPLPPAQLLVLECDSEGRGGERGIWGGEEPCTYSCCRYLYLFIIDKEPGRRSSAGLSGGRGVCVWRGEWPSSPQAQTWAHFFFHLF